MNHRELDRILEPFEKRAVPRGYSGEADRAAGIRLGAELNRLQGAVEGEVEKRLDGLLVSGRISEDEYVLIAGRIAQAEARGSDRGR